jgi:hypothetical protein
MVEVFYWKSSAFNLATFIDECSWVDCNRYIISKWRESESLGFGDNRLLFVSDHRAVGI